MQLPTEVLEAIIDQASDNTACLRHLSLTCTTLLPRSRYHLFNGIVIRTVQQLESSPAFLDSCPWLAPLVRKITLFIAIPRDNSKPNVRLLDVVPIPLLTRLPNLHAWMMGAGDNESANVSPSLSLHHYALRCYRKHGGRIRSLELSIIVFHSISDFRGLVSAFTGLDSLTCYGIGFQSREREHADSSPVMAGTSVVRPLQISTLKICTSVDSWAVEYLLACSGPKLKRLSLQLRTTDCRTGSLKHLEQLTTQLTSLSSLALMISPGSDHTRIEDRFSRTVRSATRILQRVDRGRLNDVRVEFKVDPLSKLGACLSGASAPLEACKALEAALLTFPNSPIVVRDPVRNRRAGRAKLWSPFIRRAFPRLDARGLLTFKFTPSKEDAPDFLGHENQVTCVVISHDSARVVSASSDGTIIVWDTARQTVLQDWPAHQGARVAALALSPDGRQLVSAGGHALAVWGSIDSDAAWPQKALAELTGHTDVVNACAWSPLDGPGALIASASLDRTVRIWDGRTFELRAVLPAHPHAQEAQCLRFSPDAHCLAWISGGMECCVWRLPRAGSGTDTDTGAGSEEQPTMTLRAHPERRDVRTTAFAFDRTGTYIATAHGTRPGSSNPNPNPDPDPDACVVQIWDATTGAALAVLAAHARTVSSVAFSESPDGRSVLSAAASDDMAVHVWDWESDHAAGSWSWDSALGRTVVLGLNAATIGHTRGEDEEEDSLTSQPRFSPDGRYVAAGSVRGSVWVWRTGDGACVATFGEHAGCTVTRVVFSPCGGFLVSGDVRGIVRIRRLAEFIGEL